MRIPQGLAAWHAHIQIIYKAGFAKGASLPFDVVAKRAQQFNTRLTSILQRKAWSNAERLGGYFFFEVKKNRATACFPPSPTACQPANYKLSVRLRVWGHRGVGW